MTNKNECSLIITIVNNGFTDLVMEAAKKEGAKGGTIIHGRGTGNKEFEKFYGISVTPDKEVVLIVVMKELVDKILLAINKDAGLDTAGQGIAFAVPVEDSMGFIFEDKKIEKSEK